MKGTTYIIWLQFLHCSSDLKINTIEAESQHFILTVTVSFQIQCAGVEPTLNKNVLLSYYFVTVLSV